MDSQRFVNYVNQTGRGNLTGFVGAPVQYGRGLGAVLSRAFRFVLPFLKQGANIVKPHLKSAAKGIALDVVGAVTSHIAKRTGPPQEGSGLGLLSRGRRKRPIAELSRSVAKKRKRASKKSLRKVKSQRGGSNIF